MKIIDGVLSDVHIDGVTFKVDLIPEGRKRRPGYKLKAVNPYVTVHNTGGAGVEADNYRRGQLDISQDKYVSWHFTVGSKEIIQHIPINEVAWHAGTDSGNYNSFAIEVCEVDGAEQNAIKFIAQYLECVKSSAAIVRTHKSWSGKQCPHKILPHWSAFLQNVESAMGTLDSDMINVKEYAVVLHSLFGIDTESWGEISSIDLKNVPALLAKLGGIVQLYKDGVISDMTMWEQGKYKECHVASLIIKAANTYYPKWKAKVNVTSLNVRSGPAITNTVIGKLGLNRQIEILGITNGWYKINYQNKVGYISSQYVTKI